MCLFVLLAVVSLLSGAVNGQSNGMCLSTTQPIDVSTMQQIAPQPDCGCDGPGAPSAQSSPNQFLFRVSLSTGLVDTTGVANIAIAAQVSIGTPIMCYMDPAVPSKSSKKGKRSVNHGHSKKSKSSKTLKPKKQVKNSMNAKNKGLATAGVTGSAACKIMILNCSSASSSNSSSSGGWSSSQTTNQKYILQVAQEVQALGSVFVILTNSAAWTAITGNSPTFNAKKPIASSSLILNQPTGNTTLTSFTPFGPWTSPIFVQFSISITIYFGSTSIVGNLLAPVSPLAPITPAPTPISPPSNAAGISLGIGCILVPGGGSLNNSVASTSSISTSTSSSTSTSTSTSSSTSTSTSTSSSSASTGSTGTGSTASTASTASPSTTSVSTSVSTGSSPSSVSSVSLSTPSSGSSGTCLAVPQPIGTCSSASNASFPLSFFVSVTIINPVIVIPVVTLSCPPGPQVPCLCGADGNCYSGTPGTVVNFFPYCGASSSSSVGGSSSVSASGCGFFAYITTPGASFSCGSNSFSQGNQDSSDFTMNTLSVVSATCVANVGVCRSAKPPQFSGPMK